MAKTLILSQKQLNEIIDGTPYLDVTDKGMPSNSHSNEVDVTGGVKSPKPITSDEIADWAGQSTNNWTIHGAGAGKPSGIPIVGMGQLEEVYTKKDFEKMMLQELNDELNNLNMSAEVSTGVPGESFTISGKEGKLAKYKTLAKQSGNREVYMALDKALNAQRARVKSDKQTKANAGMPNQFIKPHNKNTGGKAHTKKNNSLVHVIEPIDNN